MGAGCNMQITEKIDYNIGQIYNLARQGGAVNKR